jgi:cytochrome c1
MGAGNPPGPNAVVMNSGTLASEQRFRELLRHPSSAMMRSFSPEELTDAQVHELYVYLQTLKSPSAQ